MSRKDALQAALARIPERKKPPRPGKVLVEDHLEPFQISQNYLARSIGVHPRDVNSICSGRRSITTRMAILIGKVLGTGASYWLRLQAEYDIYRMEDQVLSRLPRNVRPPPDVMEDFVEIDF